MKKLLPGVVVGIGLFLLVTQPADSAEWVSSAASVVGDIFDGALEFLKQLIE